MYDVYRAPSGTNDGGGLALNMFAQAKTGQLSLMDRVEIDYPVAEPAETAPVAEEPLEELPTEQAV